MQSLKEKGLKPVSNDTFNINRHLKTSVWLGGNSTFYKKIYLLHLLFNILLSYLPFFLLSIFHVFVCQAIFSIQTSKTAEINKDQRIVTGISPPPLSQFFFCQENMLEDKEGRLGKEWLTVYVFIKEKSTFGTARGHQGLIA